MIFRTILLTLVLTAAGVVLILIKLGSGALLYVAMLGASAVWLLPAPFALALPAGAFGGVLFTHADREARDMIGGDSSRETVHLAVFALVLSLLTVGWLMPWGNQASGRLVSRFHDTVQLEQREVRPETLTLDELVSAPGARQELWRRAAWIAPSFFMPLVAAVLIALNLRWTYGGAAAATLAVFVVSVQLALRNAF